MLTEILANKLDNFSNLDQAWYQIILDHKTHIREESTILEISDEDKARFKYKLEHFLRENGINNSIHWIIRLINELDMYYDFTILNSLYIPPIQVISNLYRQYRTSAIVS